MLFPFLLRASYVGNLVRSVARTGRRLNIDHDVTVAMSPVV